MDREDLEEHCLTLSTGDVRVDAEASSWIVNADPEALIETLWRVGFLRARAIGGEKGKRRSGSSYLGPHQISSMSLQNIKTFQVHPMFREALALKEK